MATMFAAPIARTSKLACRQEVPLNRAKGICGNRRAALSAVAALEIRLVRNRHAVGEHTLVVLGAGFFVNARPLHPAITVGGRPWLIEGVGIVNCKSNSKHLIVHQLPSLDDV